MILCSLIFLISLSFLLYFLFFYNNHSKHSISPNYNILITGGCMGMGAELAKIFAERHKCNIIIVDINKTHFEELSFNLNFVESN